jgi:FlaA1/EpsC-like NDP-sugar epimerase
MKKMQSNIRLFNTRAMLLGIADVLTILFSYFFALLLRFDFAYSNAMLGGHDFFGNYYRLIPLWCAVTIAVFMIFRLYRRVWRLASVAELQSIVVAYLMLVPCYLLIVKNTENSLPRSVYIMGCLINFCMTTGLRFSFRILNYVSVGVLRRQKKPVDGVMVIGAGAAGQMLIKEMQASGKILSKV